MVAIGDNLDQAYESVYDAEFAAQVYYQALQVGEPIILTEAQIQEVYDVYT